MAAVSERVFRWWRAHPRTVDAGLAVLLLGYSLRVVPPGTDPGLAALFSTVACGALALRRTRPLGTFSVVAGAVLVQLALGVGFLPADAALLVTTYTVAAHRGLRVSPAAAVVAAACWVLGRVRWDHVDTVDLGYILVATAVAWLLGVLVRDNARRREREREQQARIVAAAERARLAREIHDVVSHGLGAVVALAGGAAATARRDPGRAEEAMHTVETTGRTALADMRRLLDVLRESGTGDHPGVAQVEQLITDARAAGSPVRYLVDGVPRPLPADADLAVYRTVQEGLTNARRHAGPALTRVDVVVHYGEDELRVTVRDDGAGPAATTPGHGLAGMRERVTGCGGTVHTGPGDDGGFVLSATIPV